MPTGLPEQVPMARGGGNDQWQYNLDRTYRLPNRDIQSAADLQPLFREGAHRRCRRADGRQGWGLPGFPEIDLPPHQHSRRAHHYAPQGDYRRIARRGAAPPSRWLGPATLSCEELMVVCSATCSMAPGSSAG